MERRLRKTLSKSRFDTLDAKLLRIPEVSDAVNFELADFHDIQHMNLMHQSSNDKIYPSLLSSIAINGVQAVVAGDLEYVDALLKEVTDLAFTSSACTLDFIKTCNSDGFNIFHAAVIYKRLEVIHMIMEHGREIICEPTKDKNQDTPLILAIKYFTSFVDPDDLTMEGSTSLDMVTCLIEFGADVNAANKKGSTPLIYAVKCQLPDVVDVLVKAETFNSINTYNNNGNTALCYAAIFDNIEIAKKLLSSNANVSVGANIENVALHFACKFNSESVLQLLLNANSEHTAAQKLVNKADKDGNTPLMLAKSAPVYSPNIVRLLISHGPNLMAFNHYHNRILHFYSSIDDKDINEDILQMEPSLLCHKNYDRETPLHVAAKYGHANTCFLYAEKGADIYAKDAAGVTPMMNAIVHQHKEVVKVFFEFKYAVDSLVKHDKMLLEWAIEQGHIVLIEAMAETNPRGIIENFYNGSSLIHYVCKIGNTFILKYLLNWDERAELPTAITKPDCPLGSGYYPTHIAVKNDHLECVKMLCKYGYNFKAKTLEDLDTPLHIAARDGHLNIIKYLLSQGLDSEVVNYAEGTPLSSAAYAGRYNVVVYLLSIGACAHCVTDGYHTTPLLLACKEGHDAVVKLLLEHSVDVTTANDEGHNCLIEAILRGHSRTALTILNSKHWRKVLQFRTLKNETPMRLLIQHMPDVAEVALYRCVNRESMVNSKGSNEATKIEYSYEFLEDYVTPQPTLANFIQDKFTKEKEQPPKIDTSTVYENPSSTHDMPLESFSNVQNFSHSNNTSQENVEEDTETNDDQDAWWLQEKYDPENHPLELMVKYKRTSLLMTPVVEEMRTRKWKRFGLPAFIFNLAIYSLFLALFTAVLLVTPLPQSDMCSVRGCWSSWGSWSTCNEIAQCENLNGTRSRSRICTKGYGSYRPDCAGNSAESGICSVEKKSLEVQPRPMDKMVREGQNVTFSCTITGNSSTSIRIMWYNEHGLLNDDDSNVVIDTKRNGNTSSSNLTLIEVSSEDAQTYTCNGSNGIDTVAASAMLNLRQVCQSTCHYKLQTQENMNCTERGLSQSSDSFLFTADILIVVFSISQFVLELFQFWRRKLEYVKDLENWVEIVIFVLSVTFSACHLRLQSDCFCPDKLTWTVGILAIFLGWINQVYFLRRLPYTGITISIMYNILNTFAELTVIAALLVFSFSLPFFMLLTIPNRRTPFSDLARSMLNTLVMTTGEFEFDTIFINTQELVDEGIMLFLPDLTVIIWVIFIIVMPILFGNLLVGLAVGDTQAERAKAQLTRISLQVRLILELEDTMSVLRYYSRNTRITFTRDQTWYSVILGGKNELERKEAQLVAWERNANFEKVQELLKADPVHKIQESLNQRMEDVYNMHVTFIERIDHLEDQLSAYLTHLEQSKETSSDTETTTHQQWKSTMSLNSTSSSTVV